jgi:hypothetical protein
MLPLLRKLSVCLALLAVSVRSAIAQEGSSEPVPAPDPASPPDSGQTPEPVTTPPVAEQSTDVPYPEGASGDAAVELELIVEVDGTVSSAVVLDGAEPFAERARQAALTWRFTPAQQNGVAVAARIRARVAFRQEPEEESQAAPEQPIPAPTATSVAVPPPPPPPVEVTVRGARREVGQTTLTATEVRQMPGAFGDPFRAIEPLPGVTPYVSGVPYFYVRGAPPNDNGYYVDGIRVPLLFHVGLGEGVIHPGLIDRIEFFPSVAPARYGGFVGATIAGQTREPAPEFRGEANLRLIDAGALLEAPFADGRGNALVAGRYGYPGPVIGAITPEIDLDYWDYQARASVLLGDRNRLGVFAFGSHDYLATGSIELREQLVSDFHRLDLRFDHDSDAGRVRFAVTGGYDRQGADPTYVTDHSLAARLEIDQELSPALRMHAGASAQYDRYTFQQNAVTGPMRPDIPSNANPPPTNITLAAHADVAWRIVPGLEVTPGLRLGLFHSTRADAVGSERKITTSVPTLDPRLALRFSVTQEVALLTALGLAHQYPTLRVGEIPPAIVSVPGYKFGSRKLQQVAQASQGIEFLLPADIVLTTTGFVSYFSGLTDLTSECYQPMRGEEVIENPGPMMPPTLGGPWICPSNEPVSGLSFGGELLLQRPITKRLSGLFSYTLSRSTRKAHFVDAEGVEDIATVPSENDRTHVLNAVLGYELGRRWRAGGRFTYFTGNPYSKMDGNIPIPPYNSERHDSFYRVDFRIERSWPLGEEGSIALVLEGINVTLNKQQGGVDCEGHGIPMGETLHSTTTCTPAMIGPITIPSIGVEAFF